MHKQRTEPEATRAPGPKKRRPPSQEFFLTPYWVNKPAVRFPAELGLQQEDQASEGRVGPRISAMVAHNGCSGNHEAQSSTAGCCRGPGRLSLLKPRSLHWYLLVASPCASAACPSAHQQSGIPERSRAAMASPNAGGMAAHASQSHGSLIEMRSAPCNLTSVSVLAGTAYLLTSPDAISKYLAFFETLTVEQRAHFGTLNRNAVELPPPLIFSSPKAAQC